MKLTYLANDRLIGLDGNFNIIKNQSIFDPRISAIQWENDKGEIEFFDKENLPNIKTSDQEILELLLSAWEDSEPNTITPLFEVNVPEVGPSTVNTVILPDGELEIPDITTEFYSGATGL